jgi:DMSO/TMAO reductase YedYZ molybdopterin-dependent catalytic subunit
MIFSAALLAGAALSAMPSAIAAPADASQAARFVTDRIGVTGAVAHPLTLDVAALKAMPQSVVTLERKGADKGGDSVGRRETYKGVLMCELLTQAAVNSVDHNDVKKTVIVAAASDGYKVVFSWSEVCNSPLGSGIVVYYEKDGAPLPDTEGHIALISTQDTRTGPRHVKWLQALDVRKVVD